MLGNHRLDGHRLDGLTFRWIYYQRAQIKAERCAWGAIDVLRMLPHKNILVEPPAILKYTVSLWVGGSKNSAL